MPMNSVTGIMLQCSFGAAPSSLAATPGTVMVEGRPAATISDIAPGMNVPPFGVCSSMMNPQVASATAAALGVLTPMPCVPVPAGTWVPPASRTLIGGKPALTSGATLTCAFGGVINQITPGATRTMSN